MKTRWSLTVDQGEKDVLAQWASNCPDACVEVDKAPVAHGPAPDPELEPDPGCHPAYPDFCIPPPPPDKNCNAVGW